MLQKRLNPPCGWGMMLSLVNPGSHLFIRLYRSWIHPDGFLARGTAKIQISTKDVAARSGKVLVFGGYTIERLSWTMVGKQAAMDVSLDQKEIKSIDAHKGSIS
jgi:hypothetical protein